MPPREIRALHVSVACYLKLAAKGIDVEEVRQVVANAAEVRKGPKNRGSQAGRCYFVVSATDAGRALKVLVRRFDGGIATVITAWEP